MQLDPISLSASFVLVKSWRDWKRLKLVDTVLYLPQIYLGIFQLRDLPLKHFDAFILKFLLLKLVPNRQFVRA